MRQCDTLQKHMTLAISQSEVNLHQSPSNYNQGVVPKFYFDFIYTSWLYKFLNKDLISYQNEFYTANVISNMARNHS